MTKAHDQSPTSPLYVTKLSLSHTHTLTLIHACVYTYKKREIALKTSSKGEMARRKKKDEGEEE